MNIPSIGTTRGIFEIFIPGVFLLLNILVFTYFFSEISGSFKNDLIFLISNQILSLVIIISFGYLIGVILRLLKTKIVDKLSGCFCWMLYGKFKKNKKAYWFEPFPYFTYISRLSKKKLPVEASIYFNHVWEPIRYKVKDGNREFFNYCKTLIYTSDDRIANEIYSAEALIRYVSGMFYALFISSLLIFLIMIYSGFKIFFLVVGISYLLAIAVILFNFRFLRIKEVETVFVASLHQNSNISK